jgi:2-phospho-L-lactate guanylyltransferase
VKQRAIFWAVMPVKHLSHAKSRLAVCLGDDRSEFAKSLFLHTLDAVQSCGLFGGVLVVTPDAQVVALAEARGARTVTDHGASLNAACSLGLSASRSLGGDFSVFVHADLALLRAEDLTQLLQSYRSACETAHSPLVGLVRCKDGDGTNIVICPRTTPFEPHFGPQSFARHAAVTSHCELQNANAAFDIDTGDDLLHLLAHLDRLEPSDPIALLLRDDRLRRDILQRCPLSDLAQPRHHLLGKQF